MQQQADRERPNANPPSHIIFDNDWGENTVQMYYYLTVFDEESINTLDVSRIERKRYPDDSSEFQMLKSVSTIFMTSAVNRIKCY